MNKKIIAGAVIALAAGLATFIYKRNKSRIDEAAADAYNAIDDSIKSTEREAENIFA